MLKRRVFCALWLLIISTIPAFSDETKKNPIDQALDRCIEKDQSTAGMANCTINAEKMWDREMNKVYNELAASLEPEQKEALKTAQKNWIQYRDSEFALLVALYSKLEGTMYIPMRAADRMEIIKQRTLQLQSRLDLLQER